MSSLSLPHRRRAIPSLRVLIYSPQCVEGVFSEVGQLVSILAALVEGGFAVRLENRAEKGGRKANGPRNG